MADVNEVIKPESDYFRLLGEGKFMLLRSKETGNFIFHPRVAEPLTGCTDLEWVEASGKGVVYSTSVMRQRDPAKNYNIALIDLAEGPRMMSRVEGIAPESVKIGLQVQAKIVQDDGRALVFFTPV
jgi:uncharacterized OB-fold protein